MSKISREQLYTYVRMCTFSSYKSPWIWHTYIYVCVYSSHLSTLAQISWCYGNLSRGISLQFTTSASLRGTWKAHTCTYYCVRARRMYTLESRQSHILRAIQNVRGCNNLPDIERQQVQTATQLPCRTRSNGEKKDSPIIEAKGNKVTHTYLHVVNITL
jgi:hypothetical protein